MNNTLTKNDILWNKMGRYVNGVSVYTLVEHFDSLIESLELDYNIKFFIPLTDEKEKILEKICKFDENVTVQKEMEEMGFIDELKQLFGMKSYRKGWLSESENVERIKMYFNGFEKEIDTVFRFKEFIKINHNTDRFVLLKMTENEIVYYANGENTVTKSDLIKFADNLNEFKKEI